MTYKHPILDNKELQQVFKKFNKWINEWAKEHKKGQQINGKTKTNKLRFPIK